MGLRRRGLLIILGRESVGLRSSVASARRAPRRRRDHPAASTRLHRGVDAPAMRRRRAHSAVWSMGPARPPHSPKSLISAPGHDAVRGPFFRLPEVVPADTFREELVVAEVGSTAAAR